VVICFKLNYEVRTIKSQNQKSITQEVFLNSCLLLRQSLSFSRWRQTMASCLDELIPVTTDQRGQFSSKNQSLLIVLSRPFVIECLVIERTIEQRERIRREIWNRNDFLLPLRMWLFCISRTVVLPLFITFISFINFYFFLFCPITYLLLEEVTNSPTLK